ncbi:MAG: response regulator transcription factor [Candidatus Gracilibacteria bacterium]|nr:response regulator transcription factor [Candidatus Gracilibacteria bacterium]
MQKILIIEDDIGISNSLKLYLINSGFEVDVEDSGKNAVEIILSNKYDLIILDINLPIKDGITICREVRITSNIPIVMLTARSGELDKIIGLEIGADDYISKPFSPRELLARINTILRRINNNIENKDIIKIKDIEIDTKKITVFKKSKEIALTKNEFEIFKKIAEENGKMVGRETLMKDIIGYDNYAFDRTIDTHIKNIRKKLQDKDIILTIRGLGYRLNI